MDDTNETPRIIRLATVDSTNNYLRSLARSERLPEGSVVVAGEQTAGRGQRGHSWESAPGQNLTFSLVVYPTFVPVTRQFCLSQIAALSVRDTLARYTDGLTVKWPNDVYWNDRKICGMLIENDLKGSVIDQSVIGIGINLNQDVFTGDAPNPVSLRQITGATYAAGEVLDAFLSLFCRYYLSLLQEKEDDVRDAYRRSLYRGTGYHPYKDPSGTFDASIAGIEPTGHLLLHLRSGETRRYAFKEVVFL